MFRARLSALRVGLGLGLLLSSNAALLAQTTPASTTTPSASETSVQPTAGVVPMGDQPVQLPLPQASPRASVTQTFGLTEVTVDYHAPAVRGRSVWGGLVPYEQVWRAGANENTLIKFSTNVLLRGQSVPAGQYSYYVVPHQDREWELVLNKVTTHWGAEGYNAKDDAIRVTTLPETTSFHETLHYWFTDIKPTGAHLNLSWEKLTLVLPIETEVHKQVMTAVEQVLQQKPNDWQLLAQAADYLVQNNIEPERALTYINESLRLQDAATNNWIKARLLAQQQDFGTAIVYARKAIKLGDKEDNTFKNQLPSMRIALTEWQAKAY